MQVLIVESRPELGEIWKRHLERHGMAVSLVHGQDEAIAALQLSAPQLIVLDLVLEDGSAFAVADYANYRHPDTRVIFTTNTSFFSDGSIFRHAANACAFVPNEVNPDDLAAMVEYYGKAAS